MDIFTEVAISFTFYDVLHHKIAHFRRFFGLTLLKAMIGAQK